MAASRFREQAHAWLEQNADSFEDLADPYETAKAAQQRLYAAGFAGIEVPREYGGQGLTDNERRQWAQETQHHHIPTAPLGISLGLVVPTLLELGSHEQRLRYVVPLIRGEMIACQLFSEPDAGSDLAALKTRAVSTDDGWVVNGQKVWTTHAHRADIGILLARTNPDVPKHRGITMFVMNMHDPAVTVRGLRDMTGGIHFNQVFFDELRLPADAVVGQVDAGWDATIAMLKHERLHITHHLPVDDDPASAQSIARIVRELGRDRDPVVRSLLAEVFISQRMCELFAARIAQEAEAGIEPGPRGSIGKLAQGRRARLMATAMATLAGARTSAWDPDDETARAMATVITGAARFRIGGGTDEIQRNVIGERVLGLPKDR